MADEAPKGVTHRHSIEAIRAFRKVSAEDKLRWLEEMRLLLRAALPPERLERLQRFRKGEL